jgi:hypothetical protein
MSQMDINSQFDDIEDAFDELEENQLEENQVGHAKRDQTLDP